MRVQCCTWLLNLAPCSFSSRCPVVTPTLYTTLRYPVLSGSPLRADIHTTTIATIWRKSMWLSTQSPSADRTWRILLVSSSVLSSVCGSCTENRSRTPDCVKRQSGILSIGCRWNDISAISRPRGLWASMRHLDSRQKQCVSTRHKERVASSRSRQFCLEFHLYFRYFFRDVYLELRLRRGWLQYRSQEFFAPHRVSMYKRCLRRSRSRSVRTHVFQSKHLGATV